METVDLLSQKEGEEILNQDELQTLKDASILQQAFRDQKQKRHVLFATSTDEGKLTCQTYHSLFYIDF
jgi:hypothetical protein